jgi:hypothetical protein
MSSTRRTVSALSASAVALGALTAGAVASAAGPAAAAERRADITARPSDDTVESGEQFVVRGRFTIAGAAAAGRTVKIQGLYGGDWRPISGAAVTADSEGRYRVRIILSVEGDRTLRAVGVVPGPARNAYEAFAVLVG